MDMTIEEFNAVLTSEKDDTQLMTSLRKLTTLENPEDIVDITSNSAPLWWVGWS